MIVEFFLQHMNLFSFAVRNKRAVELKSTVEFL